MKLPPTPKPLRIDEIGFDSDTAFTLAQLLAYGAAVREECAKLCDAETNIAHGDFGEGWVAGAKACAAAIREEGE